MGNSDLIRRAVRIGISVLGGLGAIVGLIVGLITFPPTACFAVFELGVPAAMVGAALGLAGAWLAILFSRARRHGS